MECFGSSYRVRILSERLKMLCGLHDLSRYSIAVSRVNACSLICSANHSICRGSSQRLPVVGAFQVPVLTLSKDIGCLIRIERELIVLS